MTILRMGNVATAAKVRCAIPVSKLVNTKLVGFVKTGATVLRVLMSHVQIAKARKKSSGYVKAISVTNVYLTNSTSLGPKNQIKLFSKRKQQLSTIKASFPKRWKKPRRNVSHLGSSQFRSHLRNENSAIPISSPTPSFPMSNESSNESPRRFSASRSKNLMHGRRIAQSKVKTKSRTCPHYASVRTFPKEKGSVSKKPHLEKTTSVKKRKRPRYYSIFSHHGFV